MNALDLLLLALIVGFVGGILATIVGFYLSDRWVAIVGLAGALAFGAAIALYGIDW